MYKIFSTNTKTELALKLAENEMKGIKIFHISKTVFVHFYLKKKYFRI